MRGGDDVKRIQKVSIDFVREHLGGDFKIMDKHV